MRQGSSEDDKMGPRKHEPDMDISNFRKKMVFNSVLFWRGRWEQSRSREKDKSFVMDGETFKWVLWLGFGGKKKWWRGWWCTAGGRVSEWGRSHCSPYNNLWGNCKIVPHFPHNYKNGPKAHSSLPLTRASPLGRPLSWPIRTQNQNNTTKQHNTIIPITHFAIEMHF